MMIIKQFILFIFLLFAVNVDACTTFCLSQEGGFVFGRNYDWHLGHGLVIVNKKGIQKRSFTFYPEEPVDWVSKYGSVTFNQFGREFPLGGMNEKGLVVEVMWLEETVYQGKDDRPVMNELQWVQYQLDNFKSVKEVLKELENIRIGQTYTPIHYLVADSKGIVASIEHIKGETVIHTGDDLPVPVLTNDTYDRSLNYVDTVKREDWIWSSDASMDRFLQVSQLIRETEIKKNQMPVGTAFNILDTAAQFNTMWSIVYDITETNIYFKTARSKEVKKIHLDSFDFSCSSPAMIMNIDYSDPGNVSDKFVVYEQNMNAQVIRQTFTNVDFLVDEANELIDRVAQYPESMICR